MRVLEVSDSFAPRLDGVALAVWREAQRFVARGDEVTILAVTTDPAAAVAQCEGVCHMVPRKARFEASSGYPVRLLNGRKVAQVLDDFQPDVVRFHTFGPLGIEALLAARRRGLRIEHYWHTDLLYYARSYPFTAAYLAMLIGRIHPQVYLRARHGPLRFIRDAAEFAFRDVASVTAPSEKTAKQARWFGYQGPIEVRPSPASLTPPEDAPTTKSGTHVVYLGRIAREKNLRLLTDAFVQAVTANPALTLTIAGPEGDKRTRRRLERWLARHSGQAEWVGGIPRGQVARLLSSADLVVIPSLSETQCLVVGEARSVGVPVLLVDADLALSYADDDGVYVAEPNANALAATMVALLARAEN